MLKQYLYLDVEDGKLKLRVVKGFTEADVDRVMTHASGWTPSPDKNQLYFFPGCSVPRHKVREKFKVVIKPEKATAAFLPKTLKGSESTFEHFENCRIASLDEFNLFMSAVADENLKMIYNSLTAGDKYNEIYLSWNLWYYNAGVTTFTTNSVLSVQMMFAEERYYYIDWSKHPENQLYHVPKDSVLNRLSCPIYMEQDVLAVLGEHKQIIDQELYTQYRAFGDNGDDENLILLMELMGNCNFQESIVYLLFLIKEFGKRMQEKRAIQHVNFRSLLIYIAVRRQDLHKLTLNDFKQILKKSGKWTRTNAYRVSQLFANDYINYDDVAYSDWQTGPVLRMGRENFDSQ